MSPARERAAMIVALLLYAVALGVGMSRHELWRDETQAWSVARASSTPAELLVERIRYEGHPPAWYLLLWPVGRLTADPRAMQPLHGAIALATAAVWLTCAPFPPWLRVLLLFGYFPLYEWGVLSRNYNLGWLAAFGVLALWPRRRRQPLAVGALLGLMTLANAYALLLAAAFGATLTGELAWERLRGRPERPGLRLLSLGLVAGGALVAIGYLSPPADRWSGRDVGFGMPELVAAVASIWEGWGPMPMPGSSHPWNTNVLEFEPGRISFPLRAALGLSLLVAAGLALRRSPGAQGFFWTATALLLLFSWTRWHGFLRHHGHYFWTFIAALWMALAERAAPPPAPALRPWSVLPRAVSALVGVAAVVQATAAVALLAFDLARPFSDAQATAAWLRREGRDARPIVASRDYLCSPVAAFLGRPLYYPELGAWGTYWTARRHPRGFDPSFALREARRLAAGTGSPVLLLLSAPPPPAGLAPGERELARFDQSYLAYRDRFSELEPERFHVLEIPPPRP